MRTTVDLPDDVYEYARDLAHVERISVSAAIVSIIRRNMHSLPDAELREDPETGLTVMHFGDGRITTEQVSALLDEEI
jgi:hypothetical protein